MLAHSLAGRYNVRLLDFSELREFDGGEISLFIIDVDIKSPEVVSRLSAQFSKFMSDIPKIFLNRSKDYAETVQANALGASSILMSQHEPREMDACIRNHLEDPIASLWTDSPVSEQKALKNVASVLEGIAASLNKGSTLPKKAIHSCGEVLVSSLDENGVSSWLEAVSLHHSYTYRHSMMVAGMAAGVGIHFGMQNSDVQLLAVSSILHDVGKIRIPLNILDKPGKLTEEERAIIEKHPGDGRDILLNDGQFDERVIDMVYHHHEFLDGSGYPDGLSGDQISFTVRLLTIVDIYAALIDRRPYKDALSIDEALEIMRGMEGKIDMPLLQAFEPVLAKDAQPAPQRNLLELVADC